MSQIEHSIPSFKYSEPVNTFRIRKWEKERIVQNSFMDSTVYVILMIDDGEWEWEVFDIEIGALINICCTKFGVCFEPVGLSLAQQLDVTLKLLNSDYGYCAVFLTDDQGTRNLLAVSNTVSCREKAKDAILRFHKAKI